MWVDLTPLRDTCNLLQFIEADYNLYIYIYIYIYITKTSQIDQKIIVEVHLF